MRNKEKTVESKTPMPAAEPIDTDKVRPFTSVTTMGNKFTKKVKDEPDEQEKLKLLKTGITDCIKQFISIAFERAEVNDLITNQPDFQHLQFFDPSAIFSAEASETQMGQMLSMMTNLQETVIRVTSKSDGNQAQAEKRQAELVNKLEKV